MSTIKPGDVAWIVRAGQRPVTRTCPICFGKRKVTLILGDDSRCELPCEACGIGYCGPQGTVTDYDWEARAEPATVSGVETVTDASGEHRRYRVGGEGCYCSYEEEQIDATREGAQKKAEIRLATMLCEEEERRARKYKPDKTYAWHARYHAQEAKRAREQLEYHERMAVFSRAKAKDGNREPA